MTNFEKIKNMRVEELADFISELTDCDRCHLLCGGDCQYSWKQWLKSEAENDGKENRTQTTRTID